MQIKKTDRFIGGVKICAAYRCVRPVGKHKRFCPKHHHRYQKEHNPIGYAYSLLRSNAKRRGKEFAITLEQFKKFCEDTGYLAGKGKSSTSMSIDRIDSSKGYSIDNIQILPLSENSRKGNSDCPF